MSAFPASGSSVDIAAVELLGRWAGCLDAGGLVADRAVNAARRAVAHGSDFARELVIAGCVGEADLFRLIADELGLPFQERVDPRMLITREGQERLLLGDSRSRGHVRILCEDGSTLLALSDYGIDLQAWSERLRRMPGLRDRLVVIPPAELRAALVARSRPWLLRDAVHRLYLSRPLFSAHDIASTWQAWLAGTLMTLLPVALVVVPWPTIVALNIVASTAFLSCIALRVLALRTARPLRLPSIARIDPTLMPVYSVLVALHRERAVVPQLLVALGKLQWPRARLEIKLVCEEDDEETLSALAAHRLHPCIEIVRVPPSLPRTKPKALAYALPLCTGEFLTLYDAEDRPHPQQLIEAWQRFSAGDRRLACLQAPLTVTNLGAGWLSRMFGFEYAGLFRGLLPWLAACGAVVPLGGTSNHFRRSALDAVGGWDPYNVTEDADLGMRFRRHGYRIGTLSLPTLEDGPETFGVWLPQRTRWFKGWIHTWLVHMREPERLMRELGPLQFLIAQVLFAGTILSALMHPVFLLTLAVVAVRFVLSGEIGSREGLLAVFGLANILSAYAAFILIGFLTLNPREQNGFRRVIASTPLHWCLLSVAAWLSIWELVSAPHRWNKTPHQPARRHGRRDGDGLHAVPASGQASARDGVPMILGSSSPITSMSRPS